MIRPLLVGLLVLCSTPLVLARNPAASQPSPIPDARALPMHFDWRREGPADICGTQCRIWISAVGAITQDTPRDFEAFAQDTKVRGATIVFDSEGGSVIGALALGRAIRRLGLTTSVGQTQIIPNSAEDDRRATLTGDAWCESMCTFVLLGGTKRHVPAEARVLVHQIWLGDRRNDALASTYTAEDLVLVQRDIGRLAQYTIEMGASVDLLEMALRIPPWEPMRTLSRDELSQMRVATVDTLFDRPGPEVATNAAPAASIAPLPEINLAATHRGWGLVEEGGVTVLARRQPLTLEGETIGHFDLILGCGTETGTYSVSYIESRRVRDTVRPQARLKDIALAIARTPVPLAVASSEPKRSQLSTVARGALPSSLIASLIEGEGRSITVTTATGNIRTVIRVGSVGVAQNLSRLTASCKPPATRSAHASGL